ncbi:MAG: sensor domain-containing diguanylate cyclase [Acidobacteriota bacterium]
MPIAIIYAEQPSAALLQLLRECSLATELVEYSQVDEKLRSNWQPEVVFCELYPERRLHPLFNELVQHCSQAAFFSFSAEANAQLKERSAALGFITHLDETTTARELQLHLKYGQRISNLHHSSNDSKLEQALSVIAALHFSLDISKVVETVLEYLPKLIPADGLALYISSEEGDRLELVGELNRPIVPQSLPLNSENSEDDGNKSLLVKAAQSGKSLLIQDLNKRTIKDPHYQQSNCQSVMCLPLCTHARLFGVLEAVTQQTSKFFSLADLELAERTTTALATALANARNFASAERLCQIDDLTQLYNSRYLYRALELEMKRSRRYAIPLSVIFLDLDGFKRVNDTNGHLCGSATLTEVANLMMGLVRETDIVARYGGDEFVIVLPETPAERAVTIAERIRKQIEAHVFRGGGDSEIYLTASFGVAAYPEHASSPAALIRCADKAMYTAKECNKNQVVLANG